MTYRHIMTKNYMTYDIKFSHIVAALIGTSTKLSIDLAHRLLVITPYKSSIYSYNILGDCWYFTYSNKFLLLKFNLYKLLEILWDVPSNVLKKF